MCGITGFVETQTGFLRERREYLGRMTERLGHRGPDAGGCWQSTDGRVNFGHRRLSIMDLSPAGAQPMSTPDGRYVLNYNGEIYNFPELRDELEAAGWKFRGTSDTEVLLYTLAHWGVEAGLRRLNGMFAFALWDGREQCLWLARDRFGEKPLYYAWHDGILIFGSELKSLAEHPAFVRDVDHDAVATYLRYGYVPWPYCIFKNAWKLRPGHFLRISAGAEPGETTAYWQFRELIEKREFCRLTAEDPALTDLVEETLKQAVRQRMVADVPLGAFLSGGIDSSTVVALMQAQSSRPAKTFTIGFWEAAYNEARDAARIARHLGTEHHELFVSAKECLDVIGRLPRIYDEPFADSSQIPTTLVSQFTRRHVTVALSGDAGDEMFGGYNRYYWSARLWPKLERCPLVLRRAASRLAQEMSPAAWDRVFQALNLLLPARYRVRGGGEKLHKLALVAHAAHPDDLYKSFVSQWQDPGEVTSGGQELPAAIAHLERLPDDLHFVERMMYSDLRTYLPSDILCKVDRASMSASLEVRVPFLDNELVRLAWSLPLSTRIHRGVGKWPLRQVLKRYVPEKLFSRPKTGFGIPIDTWLRGPLRDWAEDMLAPSRLADDGFFRPEIVQERWREHLSGRRNHQHALWCILMFQCWWREWRS